MQLPEYGCQFSHDRKSGNQLHKGKYHVRKVAGTSSGSSWQIMLHINLYTCLEPLLNCPCCSSSGVVVTCTLEKTFLRLRSSCN